jgi:hypothetical protein
MVVNTKADDQLNCEIGRFGVGGKILSNEDDLSTENKRETVGFERDVSMQISLRDAREESSNQPASRGTNPGQCPCLCG